MNCEKYDYEMEEELCQKKKWRKKKVLFFTVDEEK
jgi:hypothetical protein